jgi:hypothetical protein
MTVSDSLLSDHDVLRKRVVHKAHQHMIFNDVNMIKSSLFMYLVRW